MLATEIRRLENEAPASLLVMPRMRPFPPGVYECRILLLPEADGGFSAIIPRLPGAVSQGETEEEALANIKEAFRAVAKCYLRDSGTIPWSSPLQEYPKESHERWILVDV